VLDKCHWINLLAAIEDGGFGGARQQCRYLARDATAEFDERSDHRRFAKGRGLAQWEQAAVAGDEASEAVDFETTTKRGLTAAGDLACAPAMAYAPWDGSDGRRETFQRWWPAMAPVSAPGLS
jgi:hypothetical protein